MKKYIASLLIILCLSVSSSLEAYNFLFIDPISGEPVKWDNSKPIEYWVDAGQCGRLTHDQASQLIEEAVKIWEKATNIEIVQGGVLEVDVDESNYADYLDPDTVCYESENCPNPRPLLDHRNIIIFDESDGIIEQFSSISAGIGGIQFLTGTSIAPSYFQSGFVVLNCSLIDGIDSDLSVNEFSAVIIHELGHLLGLGHSAVNTGDDIDDFIFTPIMNTNNVTILRPDDLAGIQLLYDAPSSEYGSIRGTVRLPNGNEFRSAAVIARRIDDPFCEAIGTISGRACVNDADSLNCSIDNNKGDFEISHLDPGKYVLILQAIGRSSGYSVKIDPFPGNAEFWNENDTASEDPFLYTTIDIAPGQVIEGIDFVTSSNVATADQTDVIPPEVIIENFGAGDGTRCPHDQVDYAAIIGVDDPFKDPNLGGGTTGGDPTPASSGGCSLIH